MIFIQVAALWSAARIGSFAMRRLGQPAVIGELLGGLALGPSLFGCLAPGLFQTLFAPDRLSAVGFIAQAAMVAFMVCTGLEVEPARIVRVGRQAVLVAACGIMIPFAAGYGLGLCVPDAFLGTAADRTTFALFIGTAISISAIPVIARILLDLKLFHTDFGAVIISAATVDDAVGWSLLALIFQGCGSHYGSWVGFGALASGVLLSRLEAVGRRRETVKRIVSLWLAPLFFAYAGLQVDLRSLGGFGLPLLFIAVACASKIAGCFLGARLAGMDVRQSLGVGFAMNARGAVGLVLASVGLGLGILNAASYSIIVLVAVATTVMTPPPLEWACRGLGQRPQASAAAAVPGPNPPVAVGRP